MPDVTHELRFLERLRQNIASLFHAPLSLVGLYAERETPPETTVASWVRYPEGALASDDQLHLALYVGADRSATDVYAHWEPSWIRHPIRHYRATDVDAEEGIRRTRSLFEAAGIEYAVLPAEKRIGGDAAAAPEPPIR